MKTSMFSFNLPLEAINQEIAMFLEHGMKQCEKQFGREIEKERPKEPFFWCSLLSSQLAGVDIMCILDAPNFKAYKRNHRKPTGMWCGALVQTEDAGLCWMTYKPNKGKWTIYTEKLLNEWATYRQLPADTPLHEVVSDILIESMDQDGILFRCPESPDTLYQPLGSELSVIGKEIYIGSTRCDIYSSFVPQSVGELIGVGSSIVPSFHLPEGLAQLAKDLGCSINVMPKIS
jgi:hypothetical protein